MATDNPPMVWVRSKRGDAKIAAYETNANGAKHPEGVAYVAASEGLGGVLERPPTRVQRTPYISSQLIGGEIEEVDEADAREYTRARANRMAAERVASGVKPEDAPSERELERRIEMLEKAREREEAANRKLAENAVSGGDSDEDEDFVPPARRGAARLSDRIRRGDFGTEHGDQPEEGERRARGRTSDRTADTGVARAGRTTGNRGAGRGAANGNDTTPASGANTGEGSGEGTGEGSGTGE